MKIPGRKQRQTYKIRDQVGGEFAQNIIPDLKIQVSNLKNHLRFEEIFHIECVL